MNYKKITAFAMSLCILGGTFPTAVLPAITCAAEEESEYDDVVNFTETGKSIPMVISGTTEVPTWYSDKESVATVDENGVITSVGEGTACVYAVFSKQVLKFLVNVTVNTEPEIITADLGTVNLGNDRSAVTLLLQNAPEGNPVWSSSDVTVATVDQSGNVIAVGSGTCIITAALDNYRYTATIVSTYVPDSDDVIQEYQIGTFELSNTKASTKITIEVPEGTVITWSSSDESIATVDQSGIVIAQGKGNCKIIAAFENFRYIADLVSTFDSEKGVKENLLGSISLDNEISSRTLTLNLPEGAEVTWRSSDESVAVVDQEGKVTAVNSGECRIIAACGGIDYVIAVTSTYTPPEVTPPSETEFTINGVGNTLQLSSGNSDEEPEWLSMNTEVVTVDSTGLVTAVGTGEAVIIARFSKSVLNLKVTVTSGAVYGDANEDGEVTIADAVLILQSLANPDNYKLTEQGRINADVNNHGDGVTAADALVIQQVEAGIYKTEDLPL